MNLQVYGVCEGVGFGAVSSSVLKVEQHIVPARSLSPNARNPEAFKLKKIALNP